MRIRSVVALLVLLAAVGAAGYLARPHLDAWRLATPPRSATEHYQCAMHPQIVSDRPGLCPICQMELQSVDVTAPTPAAAAATRQPLFYRHPMQPDVTSPVPAKDEMGMDYIPVYGNEETAERSSVPGRASFTLSASRQQLIGVTRATVERRRLDDHLRTVGTVAYDPVLYQAIIEYREARAARDQLSEAAMDEARTSAEAIVRSASLRLRQLGLTDAQVRDLAGRSPTDLLLPGGTAWIYAQVYEYEMAAVRPGQSVSVTTPAHPGRTYAGRVVGVDPILDAATRTARVRIQVPTPDASLRPQAFVQVIIHLPAIEAIAVPADAVLPRGTQQIVFLVSGEGRFEPRAVQLGRQADGYYEVLDGLQPGDEVVTSANFLIDSESRFRSALAAFQQSQPAGDPHTHVAP